MFDVSNLLSGLHGEVNGATYMILESSKNLDAFMKMKDVLEDAGISTGCAAAMALSNLNLTKEDFVYTDWSQVLVYLNRR